MSTQQAGLIQPVPARARIGPLAGLRGPPPPPASRRPPAEAPLTAARATRAREQHTSSCPSCITITC